MKCAKILFAGSREPERSMLVEWLNNSGHKTRVAENGHEAIKLFSSGSYELVIIDLSLSKKNGLHLLTSIKEKNPEIPVMIINGQVCFDTAVESMRRGASDYITHPQDEALLRGALERILSCPDSKDEAAVNREHVQEKINFGKLIGFSDAMKRVFDMIEKVSDSDSTVVISGESGTGKELVARAIHYNSHRRQSPLVPVNCGAIPEELLESELFGHERGAFTGAIRNRLGRFELAQEGTIFLDEIADMSPSLQVKLLRVIQERQFERIGGIKTIEADVRIIAATNQDLEQAVMDKKFREDLFYRINVIPIHIPPLRQRGSDIVILTDYFLTKFNESKRKNVTGLTPEVIDIFMKYTWPGNVRELENLIEMLVVMKEDGVIAINDLPSRLHRSNNGEAIFNGIIDMPDEGLNFNHMVEQFEKNLLLKALKKTGGVKNRAAKLLNLNRTTLVEKLKRYGLSDRDDHDA
jgi:DNA-binding NtrC family response regulator